MYSVCPVTLPDRCDLLIGGAPVSCKKLKSWKKAARGGWKAFLHARKKIIFKKKRKEEEIQNYEEDFQCDSNESQ